MRLLRILIVLIPFLWIAQAVAADVVLTDDCQEDIRRLQDEIKENKDLYTTESRTRANAELTVAKTNIINPIKCRKNILDARDALRKGKKEKKEKEKNKNKNE
ncbi:MAG: hypothetical protein P8Y54_08370 [Xanthomonadales bacterium]